MPQQSIPVAEFEQEMATTRRLLERVPTESGRWKPHEKSFPLGHLAQLLAMMPSWITQTLRQDSIDLSGGGGYTYESTETLLEQFDRNVAEATQALGDVSGDALEQTWSLRFGEQVVYAAPRGEAARNHLSHLVHHRGQLSVYLRLIDVPIPSIYGPTADER